MKEISVRVEGLCLCPADLVLDQNPLLFKLSFEEAMNFKNVTLREMKNLYERLYLGDVYTGYVAVFGAYGRSYLVYMDGLLERVRSVDVVLPSQVDAASKGKLYRCVYNGYKGLYGQGEFDRVFTFDACRFAYWVQELKKRGKLGYKLSAKQIDESLKQKLAFSAAQETSVQLTNEEAYVLETFLSDKLYQRLICEH